jgi:hypothetical protein
LLINPAELTVGAGVTTTDPAPAGDHGLFDEFGDRRTGDHSLEL